MYILGTLFVFGKYRSTFMKEDMGFYLDGIAYSYYELFDRGFKIDINREEYVTL
jgi:hypothetical protein